MLSAWDALQRTLDESDTPLELFVRDDGGGWDDRRLFALLDLTVSQGVPLDLGVIPQSMDTVLARELRSRHDAAPGLIGLHQHGFAHTDHEGGDRPSEFGPSRALARQRVDLRLGRERLRGHLGHRLDALFTPPWNRCSDGTPELLVELGFQALSRQRGAPAQTVLPELGVDIDWCALEQAARAGADGASPQALGEAFHEAFVACAGLGGPVGLQLRHARMDANSLASLGEALAVVARHPRLRWRPMRDLLALPAQAAPVAGLPLAA